MFLKINDPDGSMRIIDNISSFSENPCQINEHGKFECDYGDSPGEHDAPFKLIEYFDSRKFQQKSLVFRKSYLCSDNGETLHVIDPYKGITLDEERLIKRFRSQVDSYTQGKTVLSINDILHDVFGEQEMDGPFFGSCAEAIADDLKSRGWVAGERQPFSRWPDYVRPDARVQDEWTKAVLDAADKDSPVTVKGIFRALRMYPFMKPAEVHQVTEILKINGYSPKKVESATGSHEVWERAQ